MTLLPLVLLSLCGAEQVIDAFQYADVQAARRAWVASAATPPVELLQEDGRTVLKLTAPFASDPKLPRTIIDRRVELNLAAPGEFTLLAAAESPEAGRLSLYFRSGEGWYAAAGALTKGGWQTVRFLKAAFRAEGNPAGWQKIDGIRISLWRTAAKDVSLRIRSLAALTHEVAVVVPSQAGRAGQRELKTALDAAARVADLLADLGLGADAIEETALTDAALGDRHVAVLAYNQHLSGEAVAALKKFVEAGGKLLVCYALPPQLGRAIGFGVGKHLSQQRPGDFAEIRFDAADVPGLPASVRQGSWNIAVAEPVGEAARVIGRWYDDAGKATGQPAVLLSDRGAFYGHVLLLDDRAGKEQMLAAILGKLAPPLWPKMAQSSLAAAEKVGHCNNLDDLDEQVRLEGNPKAASCLESARMSRAQAERQLAAGAFPEATALARQSHEQLAEAYLRAQESLQREGRGVWNHSGTGAYPGDWDRSAKELAENGFNMILPNMLWAGVAHYASDILPRSATFEQYGDQIAQCVAAAKKHGLQVHIWKVNHNLSNAPQDFVEQLRRAGRLQVTVKGQPHDWLCPSHPENRRLELESMLEVARKYPVDGLHFDYIRYPHRECCYCDGCRARFEADSGRKVDDWPRECYSGARHDEYHDWRCRQITALVAAVHREAKKLRPQLKVSAAVFGAYPSCRESVGQDWPEWVKAGYVDFLCPMDYTNSDETFRGLVENQLKLVAGRIPIYPGIGATSSHSALSADRVVGQIRVARLLGAGGFTVFNFDRNTAGSIVPGVGLGVGAQRAVPPHQQNPDRRAD
jgi:uncharacterized lipoprotein YddW (UPF0748 family)